MAIVSLAVGLAASPLLAADDYRYGRIRYLEAGVTIQRGGETVSELAEPNVPFLPGDRVWTDNSGRAEFQFGDGSVVRLDGRGKLEYMSAEDGQPSVLRLHAGSLILHPWAADPGFEVETPAGIVETRDRGVYRVDAEGDDVTLSVYDGEAALASGRRRVRVGQGERSYARRGDEPADPRRFDGRDQDEFARWDEEREGGASWAGERRQYIPDEVEPYAGELESHGSWYYQVEVGYVWRPYVAAGWQPYCHGRWAWTAYGWTWIPQESWGWAPFHYGRWDYAANLGWYWIPGRSWGPAWVHWAVGPNYVGWCPRGYRDRVVPYSERAYRGTAVAAQGSGAWQYSQRDQLGLSPAARRPVPSAAAFREVRVMDAPQARLGRDLRAVETAPTRPSFRAAGAGAGTAVRLKPTVGDTVPELRDDNRTTIPAPVVRRHRPTGYSPRVNDSAAYDRNVKPASAGAPRAIQVRTRPRDTDFSGVDPEVARSQPRRSSRDDERTAHPPSSASASRPRGDAPTRARDPEPSRGSERPDRGEAHSSTGASRASDPDHDVLRRIFKPLTDAPREHSGGSSGADRDRGSEGRSRPPESRPSEARPTSHRSEPTGGSHAEPRSAPPSKGGASHTQAPADKHPPKEKH
jgi:hypothetical protein